MRETSAALLLSLLLHIVLGESISLARHSLQQHFFHIIHTRELDNGTNIYTSYARITNGSFSTPELFRFVKPCPNDSNATYMIDISIWSDCEGGSCVPLPDFGRRSQTYEKLTTYQEYSSGSFLFSLLPSIQLAEGRPYFARVAVTVDNATCEVYCEESALSIYRSTSCDDALMNSAFDPGCDFSTPCAWSFEAQSMGGRNWRVQKGPPGRAFAFFQTRRGERAMIVSPYIAHTSEKCDLQLVFSLQSTSGLSSIVVSTEVLNEYHNSTTIRDHKHIHYSDGNRDGLRSSVSIRIGHFASPVRVRVECQPDGEGRCEVWTVAWNGCDDHPPPSTSCPADSFVCHRHSTQCIDDGMVCDMRSDCPGGEDEDDSITHCLDVPSSARCDFEVDCPGWTWQNYKHIKGKEGAEKTDWTLLRRLNVSAARLEMGKVGAPDGDHTVGKDGHFLFYSLLDTEKQPLKSLETNYRSPPFPPFGNDTVCKLHFYYCEYGPATAKFQLEMERAKDIGEEIANSSILWTLPSKADNLRVCSWKRIEVDVPSVPFAYRLVLKTTWISFNTRSLFGISVDDVSMTPGCFPKDSLLSSPSLSLHACPRVAGMAMEDACRAILENTAHGSEISIVDETMQWMVSETNEYRIELCGSAWLSLAGSCVWMRVVMNASDLVTMRLGHPCEALPCGSIVSASELRLNERVVAVAAGGGQRERRRRSSNSSSDDVSFLRDTFVDEHLVEAALIKNGANALSGSISLQRCPLDCPLFASCSFLSPDSLLARCTCEGEQHLEEGEECPNVVPVELDEESSFLTWLLVLILAASLLTLCVLLYRRRMRRDSKRKHHSQEMQALTAFDGCDEYRSPESEAEIRNMVASLPQVIRTNVILKDLIGNGAFGEVYRADLIVNRDDGTDEYDLLPIAVKTLPFSSNSSAQQEFIMEACLMNRFDHPNIITFYGVNFESVPRYLVLELMLGGDLKTFLRLARPSTRSANPFSMCAGDLLKMALDVARGCDFMERNQFIHRDIAARNCLLTERGANRVVKIADFGMARDIYQSNYYRKGGHAMIPVKWMPPEAFLDGVFTSQTDVWSYGVLLWELFSMGCMPYPGMNNHQVMSSVTNGHRLERLPDTPEDVHDVMMCCWRTNASDRPTFATLMRKIERLLRDESISRCPLPTVRSSQPPSLQCTPCTDSPKPLHQPVIRVLGMGSQICDPYSSTTESGQMELAHLDIRNGDTDDEYEEDPDPMAAYRVKRAAETASPYSNLPSPVPPPPPSNAPPVPPRRPRHLGMSVEGAAQLLPSPTETPNTQRTWDE